MSKKDSHLEIIKDWLSKQPHLPQKVDDRLLERFLHCCDYSLEKSKQLIDFFFTIRSQIPEIFDNRDPNDPGIKEILETFDMVPLPIFTKENYQLLFYRLTGNPDNFHYVNSLKVLFMFADIRMLLNSTIPDGEIPVFDMANFTLKHLTKVNLPVMKKYMIYSQEAHPIKLKQIHCLNIPSYIDRCMALVKPFLKSEVSKMINFHQPNSNTLFESVNKDLLPEECGGNFTDYNALRKQWIQNVINHRDYFLDEARWKVDESKRPVDNNSNAKQLFGMQGSFRSLNID